MQGSPVVKLANSDARFSSKDAIANSDARFSRRDSRK